MTTELPSFAVPRQHIDWARIAIDELDSILVNFFKSARAIDFAEPDTDGIHTLHKMRLDKTFPPEGAERKATEALNNLRHSFDQSLFAACAAIAKTPRKDVHFPWRLNPTDLEAVFRGKKNEIPPEFWDVIRGHEPYPRSDSHPGGDDVTREIARIANRKHTVGLTLLGAVTSVEHKMRTVRVPGEITFPQPKWDAVKNEMTVFRTAGEVSFDNKCEFGFNIVFSEVVLPEPLPIVEGLRMFLAKSEDVLESLKVRAIEVVG